MPDAPRPKRPADTDCPEASTCTILRDSVTFEALIADLSSRFVNLAPDEVDREIVDALRRVCEPLGIDLAVLWQWSGVDPTVILPTHAYDAQNALPPADPLRHEQFPWVVAQMCSAIINAGGRLATGRLAARRSAAARSTAKALSPMARN